MPFDYDYYKPSEPKTAKDGIKVRSQHGAFAKNWWAQRWIAALERLMDSIKSLIYWPSRPFSRHSC